MKGRERDKEWREGREIRGGKKGERYGGGGKYLSNSGGREKGRGLGPGYVLEEGMLPYPGTRVLVLK